MASAPRSAVRFFVANLPWSVGHLQLKDFFNGFGRVISANVHFDKKTGCSRGFGFVLMDDDGQILRRLENNKHLELEGSHIVVQLERDQRDQRDE